MFKHLLLPTDGSALAAKGVRSGVRLAKALGARVTGVYVIEPYLPPLIPEGTVMVAPAFDPRDYEKAAEAQAAKALARLEREARAAHVRCATQSTTMPQPWQGILKVARARSCDAVVIASHGRGGLGGLILGSQTARVLAHSKIPVLVIR
ncbi:MAG TPA: universal stress protein [Burkholderiales bacterium]|nr:universal stress protein [Burkholderiales bacterium]